MPLPTDISPETRRSLLRRWIPWVGIAIMAVGLLAHVAGWVAEPIVAGVVAAVALGLGLLGNTAHSISLARKNGIRAAIGCVGGVTTVLVSIGVWLAIFPGDAIVQGSLELDGAPLEVTEVLDGRVVFTATPVPDTPLDGTVVHYRVYATGSAGKIPLHGSFRVADTRPHPREQSRLLPPLRSRTGTS